MPLSPEANNFLNTIFLLLTIAAIIVYFALPHHRYVFIGIAGVAIVLRVVHYILRFFKK